MTKGDQTLIIQWSLAATSHAPAMRLDLAFVTDEMKKIAVCELDGFEWHTSAEQFQKDRSRDRALGADGWHILRFTGSEIHKDPDACFSELESRLWSFRNPDSKELPPTFSTAYTKQRQEESARQRTIREENATTRLDNRNKRAEERRLAKEGRDKIQTKKETTRLIASIIYHFDRVDGYRNTNSRNRPVAVWPPEAYLLSGGRVPFEDGVAVKCVKPGSPHRVAPDLQVGEEGVVASDKGLRVNVKKADGTVVLISKNRLAFLDAEREDEYWRDWKAEGVQLTKDAVNLLSKLVGHRLDDYLSVSDAQSVIRDQAASIGSNFLIDSPERLHGVEI